VKDYREAERSREWWTTSEPDFVRRA